MAVRGVAGFLLIYPQTYTYPATAPLYKLQNYFPDPTSDGEFTYDYRAFSMSTFVEDKNSTSQDFTVTFPATVENVDLVAACLTNRYEIQAIIYRWSSVEGLEAPSSFELFAFASGSAVSAVEDISTTTITARPYANAIDADLPWRKIPWTILGPLSLGS